MRMPRADAPVRAAMRSRSPLSWPTTVNRSRARAAFRAAVFWKPSTASRNRSGVGSAMGSSSGWASFGRRAGWLAVAGRDRSCRLLEQAVEVEPVREHGQLAVRRAGPKLLRLVPVEFTPALVGIAQVQRLAHAVVGGPIERKARRDQPPQRIGQRRSGRIQN